MTDHTTVLCADGRRSVVAFLPGLMLPTAALLVRVLWIQPEGHWVAALVVLALLAFNRYVLISVHLTWRVFARLDADVIAQRMAERARLRRRTMERVMPWGDGPSMAIVAALTAFAVVLVIPHIDGIRLDGWLLVPISLTSLIACWGLSVLSNALHHAQHDMATPGLQSPGDRTHAFEDYVYFAIGVATTLGTTDVTVATPAMRRIVNLNVVIAFLFNSVVVALLASISSADPVAHPPRPGHHSQAGRCAPGDQASASSSSAVPTTATIRRSTSSRIRLGPAGPASTCTTVAPEQVVVDEPRRQPVDRAGRQVVEPIAEAGDDLAERRRVEDRRERPHDAVGAAGAHGAEPEVLAGRSDGPVDVELVVGTEPDEADVTPGLEVGPRPGDGHPEAARVGDAVRRTGPGSRIGTYLDEVLAAGREAQGDAADGVGHRRRPPQRSHAGRRQRRRGSWFHQVVRVT